MNQTKINVLFFIKVKSISTSCYEDLLSSSKSFLDVMRMKKTSVGLTFLLVEGGQDAVVPAHLKVDLLLHALGDRTLRNDDADARLDGAQDPPVAVEDAPGGGHHCVPFILVIIVQSTGAEGRRQTRQHHRSNRGRQRT